MLILVAGITGMVGRPCAEHAISKGHQVRGIGRDREKVPAALRDNLEGFVTSSGIYDIPALDKAVAGVDAVICAYTFLPEVVLEGQLLLLRAAERAGVKVGSINAHSAICATQPIECSTTAGCSDEQDRFSMPLHGTLTGLGGIWASMSHTTHTSPLPPMFASARASSQFTCSPE